MNFEDRASVKVVSVVTEMSQHTSFPFRPRASGGCNGWDLTFPARILQEAQPRMSPIGSKPGDKFESITFSLSRIPAACS